MGFKINHKGCEGMGKNFVKETKSELKKVIWPSRQQVVNGTGVVVPHAIPKKAKKVIFVEGMATMHGAVSDLFDVKLYVDIDPEIQEKWFLYRAQTSRNQNEENARKQLAYVREASKKYILPKKDEYSDIVINGASSLEYFTQIIDYIYQITNNFSTPEQ